MKRLIVLLLFISQIVITNAQETRFKEGETLNIWASSGLNMRDKPDAKATKIATLPFGSKVVVQPQIGVKIPHEVEEFKGFVVKGVWLLVKAGNTEGWVFDGFLSRLPAPKKRKQYESIENYLDENIGKVGNKFDMWIYKDKDPKTNSGKRKALPNEKVDEKLIRNFKQQYKHGLLYEYDPTESTTSLGFSSSEITVYEAYILTKTFYYDSTIHTISYDKSQQEIQIIGDCACGSIIKKEGKKVVVGIGCGC